MPRTPDRFPGPRQEEEIQFDDRTSEGDPSITGALRRIGNYLRYKAASYVEQVLTVRNYPSDFNGLDLTGVSDGYSITYEASTKTLKSSAVAAGTDSAWRRHFLLMGG